MDKLVAFLVMAGLIIIGIYFFHENKLGGPAFTAFTLGLIFLFIGFYSIDRLKEFNVSGMRLVLSEMKDTKSDFDKTVVMLLEILSELNIDYTSTQGMMIGGPIPEKLVQARTISSKMLNLAEKSEQEIAQATIKIDRTMLWIYASQIVRDVLKKSQIINEQKEQEKADIIKMLKEKEQNFWHITPTSKSAIIDDLEKLLQKIGVEDKYYNEYIKDMRYYIKNNTLRRPFMYEY